MRALPWVVSVALLGCAEDDGPGAPISSTRASLEEQQGAFGWGPSLCPTEGTTTGYRVGDQLGPLSFRDCDGAPLDLTEVCGATVAWISVAHAWCPHCKENGANMEGYVADYAAAGVHVAALNVVVQDASFEPPDGELCNTWRATYEQDRVLTVFDDGDGWKVLSEESYTALNVFLDGERLITDKLYTDQEDQIRGALDAAAAR
jgi:hypothetical protein